MIPVHPLMTRAAYMAALSLAAAAFADTAAAGSEPIPAYSRDAKGIALAVTELLPSLDNCVTSHEALGGKGDVTFEIAFEVNTDGEIADLTIESRDVPVTGLDSCIEGALSAMRFQPGEFAIPVQIPLTSSATSGAQANGSLGTTAHPRP